MGLKHQVKGACLGKGAALHLLRAITGVELILTESAVAHRAINKWVAEISQVTTRFKYLGRAKNGSVNEHDVISLLDHAANPCIFYVAQHERTEWTVVIGRTESAVNLGAWIHETAALAEVDYLL